MKTCVCCVLLLITASIDVRESRGQGIHIIAGQAGVNPGAGLFTIAEKEGFYKKHGLDVEIIRTNTTAAVKAMLAGKVQIATGAGAAAFITAQLEGAPRFSSSAPGSMFSLTRLWLKRASKR